MSIAAVALSVALLIVVASLFNGFINTFEQSAVERIGDVVLAPPVKFAKYEQLIGRLEQLGAIEAATATLSAQGLLHLGEGNVRAVSLEGVEPGSLAKVTGFKRYLLKQKELPDEPAFKIVGAEEKIGGFVGIGVVAEPDEETDEYDFAEVEKIIGQEVVLTTGAMSGSRANKGDRAQFKRKTLKFTVADVVFTGVYGLDKSFIYLPIEHLQETLYPDEAARFAHQIQIKLVPDAFRDDESALAQIRGVWQAFAAEELGWGSYLIKETEITTAKQMQSRYVAELRKQMGVLLLIFSVVSFSAVLLILCIFYMIVQTRQKDIAIIKSCGAANSSAALIFVGFGGCVGIVGSAFGTILGWVITENINTIEDWVRIIFGLKLWKSSVYMFSSIPSEVDWGSALSIVLWVVIAAAVGALIPAVMAAKTRPVNILRYE